MKQGLVWILVGFSPALAVRLSPIGVAAGEFLSVFFYCRMRLKLSELPFHRLLKDVCSKIQFPNLRAIEQFG